MVDSNKTREDLKATLDAVIKRLKAKEASDGLDAIEIKSLTSASNSLNSVMGEERRYDKDNPPSKYDNEKLFMKTIQILDAQGFDVIERTTNANITKKYRDTPKHLPSNKPE